MYFKKWEELPETMRRDAVRPYYEALEKTKSRDHSQTVDRSDPCTGVKSGTFSGDADSCTLYQIRQQRSRFLSAGTGYAIWETISHFQISDDGE